MLRGLDPRWHKLLERENPRTLFGVNRQHNGGHSLHQQQENSREQLSLQPRRLYDARAVRRDALARSGGSTDGKFTCQHDSELVA